jgi:DNA (cytosine-5)-methyltransferase 1
LLLPIPEEALLRTPSAIEGDGGAITETQARAKNRMLQVRDQMAELAAMNGLKVSKSIEESLFPTPNTMDYLPARDESKIDRSKGGYANVRETVIREFHKESVLPTPTATDIYADNMKSSQMSHGSLHSVNLSRLVHKKEIDWGRFLPAIERWEIIIGRKAPDPTKPDGKEDAHRLSSSFTEWMMGLPEGFITGADVGRREELRACGNGVVPQQAEMALRKLLDL